MSSEMRELLAKYEKRLANWTREHDQCATEWAYAHRRQCSDIVDDLRALLARTEAGAGGYDDGSGRVRDWRESDTRPQDASGDAELLDWLVENEFDLVTRREDMGEDEYAIWWFVIDSRKSSPWRLHTVSGHPLGSPREAIIAAMQAKEAK